MSYSTVECSLVLVCLITNHFRKSCIVADSVGDSMILIGGEIGGLGSGSVGRYDKTGKVANLPDLIYPRHSHGCAGYRDDNDKLVSGLGLSSSSSLVKSLDCF